MTSPALPLFAKIYVDLIICCVVLSESLKKISLLLGVSEVPSNISPTFVLRAQKQADWYDERPQ
jgi:hypothetical protein